MPTLELTPDETLLILALISYLSPERRFVAAMETADLALDDDRETFNSLTNKVFKLAAIHIPTTNNLPECDNMTGTKTCARPVTHRDERGFVYCTPCGLRRKQYERCRKLTPTELRELASNNRPRAGQAKTASQIKAIQYWWDNRSHNWIITRCDGEGNQVGDAVFAPKAKLASLEVALLEQEYPDAESIKLSK